MEETDRLLARLEKHEAECTLRYQAINKQLDDGGKRFDRLEALIMSMYPFIVVSIVLAEYFR
jgi:hypothetical protein|tara:strand:+ start:1373 stop:1558 length:186 start_codon:yes stop_codon:yes gene_type:complete